MCTSGASDFKIFFIVDHADAPDVYKNANNNSDEDSKYQVESTIKVIIFPENFRKLYIYSGTKNDISDKKDISDDIVFMSPCYRRDKGTSM